MKKCPNCQQPLADDARFCPACGNAVPVTVAAAAPSFCRNCGNPMEEGSKFCTECGASVAAVAAAVVPPVAPPVTPAPAAPKRKKHTGLLIGIWTAGIAILLVLALLVSWSFGLFGGGPFGEGGLFGTVSSQSDDDDDDDDDEKKDPSDPSDPSGQTRPEDIIPLPTQPTPTVPQPKPVERVKLTIWAPANIQSEETPWLQTMLGKFQTLYQDDYRFEFYISEVSEADAKNFVLSDVKEAADVYMFANDQLGELVVEGALLPLSGGALTTVRENTSETMLNSVTYDGEVYGVPYTGNTWWMYYDKSVFTEEDVKSLDAMLAKDKVAFRLTNSWYTGSFYFANGCTMFGPTGNDASAGFDFGGEKAAAVTNYLVDLVQHPNFLVDDNESSLAGIQDGSVKAFFSGDWEAQMVKDALGDNFACAPLPTITIDGEQKQLRSFAGSKAIGVNPTSDHVEIAQLLAAYLGSAEAQALRYEMCGTIPCNPLLSDYVAHDSVALAQLNTLNYTAYVQPTIPEMRLWWATAANLAYKLISGEITHENATEKTEEFNAALNSAW